MESGAAPEDLNASEILSFKDARFEKMKEDAQKLWARKDAICNLEGFFQHHGECVNDTLQMFLTSADPIKEAVQKQLLFTDYETLDFEPFLQKEVERDLIDPEILRIYIRAFQNRFVRHYLNEHMLCSRGEAMARDLLFRASGRNTKQAMTALKVKKLYKAGNAPVLFKNFNSSKSAFSPSYIPVVLRILCRVFKLRKEFQTQAFDFFALKDVAYSPRIAGFIFGIGMASRKSGHALCFYECGKKQFIYEDNTGPHRCEWRAYFEFLEARKAKGLPTTLLFGRYKDKYYNPFVFLEPERKIAFIEEGAWNVLDEDPTHPGMFHYIDDEGDMIPIDLTEGKAYSIQAIMPIYGSSGLVRQIVEPIRARGGPVRRTAKAVGSFAKDPAIQAFLKGGGTRRTLPGGAQGLFPFRGTRRAQRNQRA